MCKMNPYPETIPDGITREEVSCQAHKHWQEGYDACVEVASELYSNLEKKYKKEDQELYEACKEVAKAYKCSPTSMQPLFWVRCMQAIAKWEGK